MDVSYCAQLWTPEEARVGIAAAALTSTRLGDQVHTNLDELERPSGAFGNDIFR